MLTFIPSIKKTPMVFPLVSSTLQTQFGTFRQILFYDGQTELVALVMGEVEGQEQVPCRLHSSCINGHYFNSTECDCATQMARAQARIQAAGRGIIVLLQQEGKGNGYLALLLSKAHKEQGLSQADAYEAVGFQRDARDYTSAAAVLQHLGVKSICLMTDNPDKARPLRNLGVNIAELLPG